jgi:hypothetical protein
MSRLFDHEKLEIDQATGCPREIRSRIRITIRSGEPNK